MTRQHRTANQTDIFTNTADDLPLFSQTSQPASESVFAPKEEAQSTPMFDRREYIAKKKAKHITVEEWRKQQRDSLVLCADGHYYSPDDAVNPIATHQAKIAQQNANMPSEIRAVMSPEHLTHDEKQHVKSVMTLQSFLTHSTCGEACWEAREDICHCSCNGRNHGILRDGTGTRPKRTARIDGELRELAAVGMRDEIERQCIDTNKATGIKYYFAHTARQNWGENPPAKMRPATASQKKWKELDHFEEVQKELGMIYLMWILPKN